MSQETINNDTIIRRSEALLSNKLGEDVVMMDIEEGAYYGLEAVAAGIWKLAEEPVSVSALCDQLMTEFDVSQEQCQTEVVAFLSDLLERDIISVVS